MPGGDRRISEPSTVCPLNFGAVLKGKKVVFLYHFFFQGLAGLLFVFHGSKPMIFSSELGTFFVGFTV